MTGDGREVMQVSERVAAEGPRGESRHVMCGERRQHLFIRQLAAERGSDAAISRGLATNCRMRSRPIGRVSRFNRASEM